ncbi:MAG: hypothetical protein HZB70_03220 [Candidatus Berkelbacteria bacterium]|nr:MAG: hypothetical protein HZB70_03220 [Candidatus Berkelbacteria bacterium]QQG51688.1 MAG: hypothetical protein HY845_03970 [Candidatus Berkelbacteria bacterium]
MKKIFYVFIALVIIALIGAGAYLVSRNKQGVEEKPFDPNSLGPWHWGALVKPFGIGAPNAPYDKSTLVYQLDLLKELGATDSRANVEFVPEVDDDFVNLSLERHLRPTLIIEPTLEDFWGQATYAIAVEVGKGVAGRYKGRVPYYQLANEASGVAIKKGLSGQAKTDYDEKKYGIFKEWLRGLSDGVAQGDPAAKRIISANWLGTGVIDRLIEDKVNFEIIGWNWYSDMGEDLVVKQGGTTFNIPEYLSRYNKEFWVVELNRREGALDGNTAAQASYIQAVGTNLKAQPKVSGLFIFTLVDQCDSLDKDYGRMGLVSLKRNPDKTCTVDAKRPSFDVFAKLIANKP